MNWRSVAVRQAETWVHYWKRYARRLRFHAEYAEVYEFSLKALAESEVQLRERREWLREYRRRRRFHGESA